MAVTVVLDHPRQHVLRRAWRQLCAFSGGTLLVVGLAASLVAVPTTLAVASFVFGWLDEPEPGEEPWPAEDVPVGEIFLAWGISTPIAIVGLKMGIRLLRGDRELVLFLRRFGYDDATKAVTFAAAKTVGGTWRLVTLDDKEIAPLGVPAGARRLFGAGGRAFSVGGKLGEPLTKVYALALGAMCAIVGLELLRAPDWRATLEDGTFDPYFDTFGQLVELHVPFDAMGWSLPGVFAVLATLTALAAAAAVVYLGFLLLMFPLAPVLVFLSSSADAMKAADEAKTLEITHGNLDPVRGEVRRTEQPEGLCPEARRPESRDPGLAGDGQGLRGGQLGAADRPLRRLRARALGDRGADAPVRGALPARRPARPRGVARGSPRGHAGLGRGAPPPAPRRARGARLYDRPARDETLRARAARQAPDRHHLTSRRPAADVGAPRA